MKIISDAVDYVFKRGRHSERIHLLGKKFVNLAPTDKADEEWIYFSALNKALKDPDVYNIALTGPYGSGKSSVIKSFLKRHRKRALEISLASFLPDTDGTSTKVSKQEIERSILQQMLYGSDANKLPLSRFKRIRAPRRLNWAISLYLLLGCMVLWYLFQNRAGLVSGELFTPFDRTNWFNLTVAAFGIGFLWQVLHKIYLKSFGISLKSISLTDVEITPETAEEESILNRHLDEIIYFFQSTKYDLVVIEDLDRFDNPDIFVTLREINSLINTNYGVKNKVRFLYALRDDIFTNTDRTKFFEFIVPIIPIINHSNSIDKVLEEGQRLSLELKLDQQFLREVSRYLNDLRLIKNVFNEFVAYSENLGSADDDSLDPNKLLAVLIYKNVQPNDFEKLHQQQGALAAILNRHEEMVSSAEAEIRDQIVQIEDEIASAELQLPKTLAELRKIYAMSIVEKLPTHHSSIRLGNEQIQINDLAEHKSFEEVISSGSLQTRSMQGHQSQIDLAALEVEIDSQKTYLERKVEIELRSSEGRKSSARKIRELRSRMAALRTEKFSNIIRTNASQIEDCFSELGESKELVKFLLFEGFLDDTYYQYISLFHSGRLSPNDNKFLIQIRSFANPEPDFRLNNHAEVIAMMRVEDFNQSYVLNRYLMDEMLANMADYDVQIDSALRYIAGNFGQCSEFFASYYSNGKQVASLVCALAERWDGFAIAAVKANAAVEHIANILKHVPSKTLIERLDVDGTISSFLGTNLPAVLETNEGIDLEKLTLLQIELEDISTLQSNLQGFRFVIENSLYQVNTENIRAVIEFSLNVEQVAGLSDRHYTTILASGIEELCLHIEQNFDTYIREVLLELKDNKHEDIETIRNVLMHDEVSQEILNEFLAMQDVVFPSLELVKPTFFNLVFEKRMIQANWGNLVSYLRSDKFDASVLSSFMQSPNEMGNLLLDDYTHDDQTVVLSSFILRNEVFSDDEYRQYVQKLPTRFKNFPDAATTSKRLILVEEDVVRLTEDVFRTAEGDESVIEGLIVHNIAAYLGEKSKYPIDDLMRVKLLSSRISDQQKLSIIEDIDPESVPNNASMAEVIGAVFNRIDIDFTKYGADFIQAILRQVKPLTAKISLFNKCHEVLTYDQVRQIIKEMPDPFPDFLAGWRIPRIPNTSDNALLVAWLEERQVISSSSITFLGDIRINTFRKPR